MDCRIPGFIQRLYQVDMELIRRIRMVPHGTLYDDQSTLFALSNLVLRDFELRTGISLALEEAVRKKAVDMCRAALKDLRASPEVFMQCSNLHNGIGYFLNIERAECVSVGVPKQWHALYTRMMSPALCAVGLTGMIR